MTYFQLKDSCRQHLTKYLIQAFELLPVKNNCRILDIGCGTGVPAITLAQQSDNVIFAVDQDKDALEYLKQKINTLNLTGRIVVSQQSVFELDFPEKSFDIVLAEGLLNVIGFEKGFKIIDKYVRPGGFFVIHDEYKNHDQKNRFIQQQNYSLINSFVLDETVWWKDFYKPMEQQLESFSEGILTGQFQREQDEIRQYHLQPELFRSIYYILKKE